MKRECGVCWWIYDPAVGDEEAAVPPGVPFEALPEDYVCPRCNAAKSRFVRPASDESLVDAIVLGYRSVDPKMRTLAIYNRALAVEAIDFRRVGELLVGALVTPWFLSVIVVGSGLPRAGSVELALPGGRFQLHAAEGGAPHLVLPLLSPVLELADPEAARAVARECVRLVTTDERKPARATSEEKTTSRRGLALGLFGGSR